MPLNISRNNITSIDADVIVNPTDNFLSGSGSIDRKIHKKAGKRLDEECKKIGKIENGEAVITDSYDMDNCRNIIHTCSVPYIDGKHGEREILGDCYRNSLNIAKEYNLENIAFPLIGTGTFAFPKGEALRIATDTITDFLLDNEMNVYLLVYDDDSFDKAKQLYADIKDYLKDNLEIDDFRFKLSNVMSAPVMEDACYGSQIPSFEPDESFSECLIRMIDEKGLSDPEVYKKANMDRKLFNHIKNDKNYRPKKETAVALVVGMELDMDETDYLLEKAGYVLSRSNKFDLIIRYCIENGIYNIYDINEILFEEDQKTLGY